MVANLHLHLGGNIKLDFGKQSMINYNKYVLCQIVF